MQLVADLRPDYMGWILSPASPRRIALRDALRSIDFVRARCPQIQHVAVLARNSWRESASIMDAGKGRFDLFQWVESPIRARGSQRLVPALRVRGTVESHHFSRYGDAPFFVLDSYVAGQPGGTGEKLNATLLQGVDVPFLLAGGLTPENLAQSWDECPLAFGVDVSSGLESSPGRKDPARVARFIKAARALPPHPRAAKPEEQLRRTALGTTGDQRSQRGFGARKGGRTRAST